MSEQTEIVEPKAEGSTIPAELQAEQLPKDGDAVLFTKAAQGAGSAKWSIALNTIFKRPNGDSGAVQWFCADEASLEAAGGDFYAVKYDGVALFKTQRVIEIPDLTEEEKAAAAPVAKA